MFFQLFFSTQANKITWKVEMMRLDEGEKLILKIYFDCKHKLLLFLKERDIKDFFFNNLLLVFPKYIRWIKIRIIFHFFNF